LNKEIVRLLSRRVFQSTLVCAALVLAGCRAPPSEPAPAIIVSVQADGSILWNGEQATLAELKHRLRAEAVRNPQPDVSIVPDRHARYEDVLSVMTALRDAGLAKLGVVGGT
jgi:biopolymer transport protein ExbD